MSNQRHSTTTPSGCVMSCSNPQLQGEDAPISFRTPPALNSPKSEDGRMSISEARERVVREIERTKERTES